MEGAITITVTQAHCDELGHLNHVEAVRYLERARSDWYRACGLFDSENGPSLPAPFRKCVWMAGVKMSSSSMVSSSDLH